MSCLQITSSIRDQKVGCEVWFPRCDITYLLMNKKERKKEPSKSSQWSLEEGSLSSAIFPKIGINADNLIFSQHFQLMQFLGENIHPEIQIALEPHKIE